MQRNIFLFLILFITLSSSADQLDPKKKVEENDKSTIVNSWRIDYLESYLEFKNLKLIKKNLNLEVDQIILDYIKFNNQKDEIYYRLEVNGSDIFYKLNSENKKEDSSNLKFQYSKLNFPIKNIFQEILFKNMDLKLDINGFVYPISIQELKANNLELFRKNDTKSEFSLKGKIFDGTLSANGSLNLHKSPFLLDVDLKIEDVSIVKLNKVLKDALGINADKGSFNLYIEYATKNNKLKGYLKFITKDLELDQDNNDNISELLKEMLIGLGLGVLEEGENDKIAGKISFSGKVDEIDYNVFGLVSSLFNHFVGEGEKEKIDNEITIKSVEN